MDYQEFYKLYKGLSKHIESLLIDKAKEYASEDRLYNFRQPTSLLDTNIARVAFYYQSKHYCSIEKITKDIDKGVIPTREMVKEKLGDLIAYSYLEYACLMEIIEKHEKGLANSETDHILLPLVDKYKDPYYLGKEFDHNDSITKCPRVTAEEALETLPLDREEQKDLEQVVSAKNQLDNLNLRTNL